jgi:hypothetical protein
MNSLSKLLSVAALVTVMFTATNVNAQTTPAKAWVIGIGVEEGVPIGNYALGTTSTLGGTIRLQYGLSNSVAITITSGAHHFFSKVDPSSSSGARYDSFGVIPAKAGLKWFFVHGLYIGAESGVGFEETDAGGGPKRFLLSPNGGWANKHWDVGIHYDYLSAKTNYDGLVALRLAYGFGL